MKASSCTTLALGLVAAAWSGCDAPPPVRVDVPNAEVAVGEATPPTSGATAGAEPVEAASDPWDVIEAWANAWTAGSVDDVMSFYEADASPVVVLSVGEERSGVEQIRASVEAALAEVEFRAIRLSRQRLWGSGDAAWATFAFVADMRRRADDSQARLEVRTTLVLRRSGAGWKIVLEHSSPIAGIPRVRPRG